MNTHNILSSYLDTLALGSWEYHPVVGSTNDLALDRAKEGAPDWTVILADEQTAGRGREDRRWVTLPGAGLAMSVVLCPLAYEMPFFSRFTALAALSLIRALASLGLRGELKWPNDILIDHKKVAGVLVEANWAAGDVEALVIGLGVNVKDEAVPSPKELRYPAASVEACVGKPVDRWALLADILRSMQTLRSFLTEQAFISEWERHLAFRNAWVLFQKPGDRPQRLKVLGVNQEGQLKLEGEGGEYLTAVSGEILMSYNTFSS